MQEVKNHTILDLCVIKTLLYYDIFHYPLTSNEVFRFLGLNSVTEEDVVNALDGLIDQSCIYQFGQFYSLQPRESLITRRIQGNDEARKCLPIAMKKAVFISRFPFVRAVMASGSLSKDYMDEHSDLDFFIVTAPSRLWICRTLLVLYKRLFLKNSHKHFCVNYFVDANHLEIEEKNLFTATELATVIPLCGAEYYHRLLKENRTWLQSYFPNFIPRSTMHVPSVRGNIFQTFIEKLLNVVFGNILERALMQATLNRWKQLYEKKYAPADFHVAFKTKAHVSKNHPRHYQKKVMDLYRQNLAAICKKFDWPCDE